MAKRILESQTTVVAAVETTYATDANPTAAANAIRAKVDINPQDADTEDLAFDNGRMGSKGKITKSIKATGSLDCYLLGSGTLGSASPLAPIFQMGGLAITENVGVDVDIVPVSESYDSATLHVFAGTVKHGLTGARCDLEFDLSTGQAPKVKATNLIGLYQSPAHVGVLPEPDISAFQTPVAAMSNRITTMTLLGQPIKMTKHTFKVGNEVVYRNVTNDESVQIVDRKSTGSITFEEPQINDFDWWSKAENNESGALAQSIDLLPGQPFSLTIPNLQIDKVSRSYEDKIAHLTVEYSVVPTSTNSDFAIKL